MRGARFLSTLCAVVAIAAAACVSTPPAARIVPSARSQFPVREWSKLSHDQKIGVISRAIELARQDGTRIRLPAAYYVREIDALRQSYVDTGNEAALDTPVGLNFKTIAVLEGDWDDGEGRVEQARRLLGPGLFEEFKARSPEKYRHLLELDRSGAAGDSN